MRERGIDGKVYLSLTALRAEDISGYVTIYTGSDLRCYTHSKFWIME
jgi:hypothetical protein